MSGKLAVALFATVVTLSLAAAVIARWLGASDGLRDVLVTPALIACVALIVVLVATFWVDWWQSRG